MAMSHSSSNSPQRVLLQVAGGTAELVCGGRGGGRPIFCAAHPAEAGAGEWQEADAQVGEEGERGHPEEQVLGARPGGGIGGEAARRSAPE